MEALDHVAAEHVSYELGEMLTQIRTLAIRNAEGLQESIDNALLEAALVHLRLLDRFFQGKDDISALSWLPKWPPTEVLTVEHRRRINWQVAHLSSHRELGYEWNDLVAMATATCDVFGKFLDELELEHPDRATAFALCRRLITVWHATDRPLPRHPASTAPSLSFTAATAMTTTYIGLDPWFLP